MNKTRLLFLIIVFASLSLARPVSLQASSAPKPVEEKKPDPSEFEFYDNVTSLEDLEDEVAVVGKDQENVKIVYRTPESCREFSVFMEDKQKRLLSLENKIKQKEETLKKLKQEFDEAAEKFGQLEKRIQKIVKKDPTDIKDNPNFEKMVKLFELLSPEESAERIKNLDLDLTIAILKNMSPKRLTQIMAALEPRLSAALSSRIIRGF